MRRGLLKDLANTPTAIACGWRLNSDISRLRALDGQIITIDVLTGDCKANGALMETPLGIAADVCTWMRERLDQDKIPAGVVTAAQLTMRPSVQRRLRVSCRTILETSQGPYSSAEEVVAW